MELSDFSQYDLEEVDIDSKVGYVKDALEFFHDTNFIANPFLDITLQIDITHGANAYQEAFASIEEASLTAYLTRCMHNSLSQFREFSWRLIGSKWYQVNNCGILFPVAVKGPQRLANAFIENPDKMSWIEYYSLWREQIRLCNLSTHPSACGNESKQAVQFIASHFIGNLPGLRFTGLTLHAPAVHGKPSIYFGNRYKEEGRLMIPLAVKFHHGNTDPVLVNKLVEKFNERISDPGSIATCSAMTKTG